MGQVGQGAELVLEAEEGRGVGPLHGLQRDDLVPRRSGPVDDPHAAAAQLAEDLIVGRGKSGEPGLGPHAARVRRLWLSDRGGRCPIRALAERRPAISGSRS